MADWIHWIEQNGVSRGVDFERLESFSIAVVQGKPVIKLFMAGRHEPLMVDDPVAFEGVLQKLHSLTHGMEIENLYSGPRPTGP